ncbi:DNA-directed RNA polymerase subunit alpha [Candidatus Shapirobacteria bacterium CG10_big_fil_rev_8_21_14_0_10_38_14]|uniref:DNA-directed RNA polymerase subunit alpha n=1 Tax=Candidatus Shapirobacteria bacterium CG10_big_fil_rev_8_21_14_0_10_38_14 TaxID=1974483 RepID=A0A2M8L5M5_9BACT|nr:MAG: DNA-directed RNA polymerase subunit alpha [Candidatus Shapirobacteria bacterium CG10_big_fil_rev_8_21_14_0_10_38_14]
MINPNFQIKKEQQTKDFGRFVIEPLQQGYGHTLGNALRRVLLSSLPGAAITQVKVAGAKHKFSTLEGLEEDLIELILNIKQIRLAYKGEKPIKLELEKSGPGQVKAGDIKTPAQVEIINKDLVLANLANRQSKLKMQLVVETGFGYLPAEERETDKLGVILVDALFSPVRRVNYWLESARVGRKTNWDKLILEITTNGAVKPSESLKQAAKILIDFFNQIVAPKKVSEKAPKKEGIFSEAMKLTVEEIELPTRIVNALRKGGYGTINDLTAAQQADLAKVKNLGEKSIKIIQAALVKKGFGLKGVKK